MICTVFSKFRRDRRGATAVMLALMLVPLIVASGAAVDFSRVSSARAQLQEAADAAALAGLGTYQNAGSQSVTTATTLANPANAKLVATQTFGAGAASLNNYLALSAPNVAVGCTDPNAATSGVDRCGPGATAANTACGSVTNGYCVKVQAQAVLKTSLLGVVIPNVTINVTAVANSPPINPISPKNAQGSTIANAYDENAIYAYGVPMAGNKPQYTQLPDPTSSCTGPVANGALTQQIHGYGDMTPQPGNCPYVQVGDSSNTPIGAQPTLSLQNSQPVAFLFVNVTGNHTAYSWVKQPDGGYCPDFTLYGSISQEPGANVPVQDSTNIYSSAYEMVGQPPSYSSSAADEAAGVDPYGAGMPYGTNHQIVGFSVKAGVGGNTAPENCPYYAYHNNTTATGTAQDHTYPAWNATYFPNNPFYQALGAAPPPVVSGCTAGSNLAHPWNYSGSNISAGKCGAAQTANFSNCALLIQDLGPSSSVPGKPTSYTETDADGVTPDTANPQRLVPNYSGTLAAGSSTQYYPPDNTAHRCYDPASGFNPLTGKFDKTGYKGLTDTSSANYDHIEKPGLGAVLCNSADPEVYALYWNDLGSNEGDDLGYWNAITLFTCSVPGSGNIAAGPSTLSG